MRNLIVISGKQYAGKDSLADFLLEELSGFHKVPLAKAIKEEFAALYGLTPRDLETDKSTYRSGLIAIGQRRRKIDPDYWIKRILKFSGPKIVSDIRLLREYYIFKAEGAFSIRLEADRDIRLKRGTLTNENDPTECDLDSITDWDAVIVNNGTIDELQEKARELAGRICGIACKKNDA